MNRNSMSIYSCKPLGAMLALTVLGCVCAVQATAQITSQNGVTVLTAKNQGGAVDFVNAKPLPLPANFSPAGGTQALIQALSSSPRPGTSGHSPGSEGTGIENPVFLGTPADTGGVGSQDYGTDNHPFTTVRADPYGSADNKLYPYRAAGKLFFLINGASYICSASLIKPGIVVTAAHCVANYGASQFYSGWQFVPGYRNGAAPYGTWTAAGATILTAYYNGTDGCYQYGVICPDDVAVLTLNHSSSGAYPGATTGWYGYGYGGYSFINGIAQITQLGYPVGLNNAAFMERTDSYGYTNSTESNNTIIGSNMNGGSSGGPWLVNFGQPAALTGETNGSAPGSNAVVGVTSWGYTSTAPKEQGAAPFTSGNIQLLVTTVCGSTPGAC